MYISIGLAIGFFLGITGAGGSIFAIPLLLLFTSLEISEAMGMSLAAVFIAAFYGCLIQIRKTSIILKPTVILACTGVLGAPVGRFLSLFLPQQLLAFMFFCLAMYISTWMWKVQSRSLDIGKVTRVRVQQNSVFAPPCVLSEYGKMHLNKSCVSCLVICGVGIGFISGMLGVGGGFMIVPALIYLSGAPISQAVCSSLVIISAVSFSGFVGHIMFSEFPRLKEIAYLSIGSIMGMQLSQLVSSHIDTNKLYKLFSLSLAVLASFIFFVRSF